jgi:hypothetical protein
VEQHERRAVCWPFHIAEAESPALEFFFLQVSAVWQGHADKLYHRGARFAQGEPQRAAMAGSRGQSNPGYRCPHLSLECKTSKNVPLVCKSFT